MKLLRALVAVLVVFFVLSAAAVISARWVDRASDPVPEPLDFVLDNVHLLPVSRDGVHRNKQLIIRDGRIAAIRPIGSAAPDMSRMNGGGAYVIPGMIDMHVHPDDPVQLQQALSYGVTAMRVMDGMPMHLRWRDEQRAGDRFGSRLFVASPAMKSTMFGGPLDVKVKDVEHAARLVRHYSDAGYDLIKVYSGLSEAQFDRIMQTAAGLELPVSGHVPHAVARADYARAGEMSTIEHSEEIYQGPMNSSTDGLLLDQSLAVLAAEDATLTPTLVIFERVLDLARGKQAFVESLNGLSQSALWQYLNLQTEVARWFNAEPELVDHLQTSFSYFGHITGEAANRKIDMVVGTDGGVLLVPIGPSYSRELDLMVQSAVTTADALRAATLRAAEVLGIEQDFGSIEVGKVADLVLLASDPLTDITATAQPRAVIKGGVYLDAAQLQHMRDRDAAGWWVSVGRFLEVLLARWSLRLSA